MNDNNLYRWRGMYGSPRQAVTNGKAASMVEMVEQMIALKREHAEETLGFSDKRHELAQHIERLDRDIDAPVYHL